MDDTSRQADSELRGKFYRLFDEARLFEVDGEDWAVGAFEATNGSRAQRMTSLLRQTQNGHQHGDLTVHVFNKEGLVDESHHFSFVLSGDLVVKHAYSQLLAEHGQLTLGEPSQNPKAAIVEHIRHLSAEHVIRPADQDLAL